MATGGGTEHFTDSHTDSRYPVCFICKENGRNIGARHFCEECEINFCRECVKAHNLIPVSKSHHVNDFDISDSTCEDDEAEEHEGDTSAIFRCSLHHGVPLDIYCKDHDQIICGTCTLVKHGECATESLEAAARNVKSNQEASKIRQELTKLLLQLKQQKHIRAQNLSQIHEQTNKWIENIDEQEERLLMKIKRIADATRKAIRSEHDEHEKCLNKDIVTLEAESTSLKAYIEKLECSDGCTLFRYVKTSNLISTEASTLLQTMTADWTEKEVCFSLDDTLENLLDKMQLFGDQEKYVGVEEVEVNFDKYVDVGRNDSSTSKVYDMCMTQSGDLLLAEYFNDALIRFDSKLQFVEALKLSGAPVDICQTDNSEVAVGILYSKLVNLVSLGHPMQITHSFDICETGFGMTYDSVAGEILTCEDTKINVYNKSGNHLRTYEKDANGENMFQGCRQIHVNQKSKRIYVTDLSMGLVILYTDGAFCQCIDLSTYITDTRILYSLAANDYLVGSTKGEFLQVHGDKPGKRLEIPRTAQSYNCAVFDSTTGRLFVGGDFGLKLYSLPKNSLNNSVS